MKKTFTLIMFAASVLVVCGQSPQKMSYQCVVRNTAGALVANHAVGLKISILQGSATGTVVFSETYSPVPQTNANGLVTVEIGTGTASVGSLAVVDWSAGPYYLKTETDPDGGTNYTITGTSQLLSVPYALYAKTASNGFSGSYNDLTNKPVLFSGSYNDLTSKPTLFDGTWNSLTGIPAGFADGIDNVDDADNSITNEIQALSLSGTVLTLSNGGGSVTLPSSGGGDNWGTQTVVTNNTLTGNGTTASPLAVANTIITPLWTNIQSLPAGFADGIDNVDDADNSITNEIQALSLNGTVLTLSNGGGSVTLPSAAGLTLPYSGSGTGTLTHGVFEVTDERTTGGGAMSSGLAGISKSSDGVGVYGQADATSGPASGVFGKTFSSSGSGVFGQGLTIGVKGSAGSASISEAYGVYGRTTSSEGYGVYGTAYYAGVKGFAEGTTGARFGVFGETESSNGYGVYGHASTTTGANFGVYGKTLSSDGCGVKGWATASSGTNYGVYGETSSGTGYGLYGNATSTTGSNYGVYGESASYNGTGIKGVTTNTSGMGIGVIGETNAETGNGIRGDALNIAGGCGVLGYSVSSVGYGVRGHSSSKSGINYGVHAISESASGYGVYGISPKYGIYGTSTGNQGRAVVGEATGTASIGVRGIATNTSSTGVMGEGANYDFYANGPGVDYGTSSSIRWKKNITSIPDPVRKVMAIRGVFFDWDNAHGGRHDVGVIAEEVGKVLPEIVVYEDNGIDAIGLDYSKLTPLLLEAVKDQQKQIEELKSEIELLKKRLK